MIAPRNEDPDFHGDFESLEAFFEQQRRDLEEANARVKPWQEAIKEGDYFRKPGPYGLTIYAHVQPYPNDPEDFPRTHELRHFRFCEAYSRACPEGELGDIHVSEVERIISEAEFERARVGGWP